MLFNDFFNIAELSLADGNFKISEKAEGNLCPKYNYCDAHSESDEIDVMVPIYVESLCFEELAYSPDDDEEQLDELSEDADKKDEEEAGEHDVSLLVEDDFRHERLDFSLDLEEASVFKEKLYTPNNAQLSIFVVKKRLQTRSQQRFLVKPAVAY